MNVLATHISAVEKEIQDKITMTKKRAKFEDGGGTLEELVAVGIQRKRDAIDERKRIAANARANAKRDLAGRVKFPPEAYLDQDIQKAANPNMLLMSNHESNKSYKKVKGQEEDESHDDLLVVSP